MPGIVPCRRVACEHVCAMLREHTLDVKAGARFGNRICPGPAAHARILCGATYAHAPNSASTSAEVTLALLRSRTVRQGTHIHTRMGIKTCMRTPVHGAPLEAVAFLLPGNRGSCPFVLQINSTKFVTSRFPFFVVVKKK